MLNPLSNIYSTPVQNNAQPLDLRLEKIRSAYSRGLFKAYENDLKKSHKKHSYSDDNWLKIIDKLVAPNLEQSDKQYLVMTYLFALAIDPQVSDEDKKEQIVKVINSLEKDELSNVHYWLGRANPIVCIKVLQYCPDDLWQEAFTKLKKYRSVSVSLEHCVSTWIETLFHCNCAITEKQLFLTRLFNLLPDSSKDDLLYEILRKNNVHEFQTISSAELFQKLQNLNEGFQQFVQAVLINIGKGERAEIPRMSENKTAYFLDWFLKEGMDNPNSDLIAVSLREEQWKEVSERFKGDFSAYAKKCILNYSKRKMIAKEKESGVWLFYSYASKYASKSTSSWCYENSMSSNFNLELSKILSSEQLYHYLSAFSDKKELIKNIAEHNPAKIIELLNIIVKIGDEYGDKVSDKIEKLFSLISDCGKFESIIILIYSLKSFNTNDVLDLLVFTSLGQKNRNRIINFILGNHREEILFKWIDLFVRNKMNPSISGPFPDQFYKLLMEINPSIVSELKRKYLESRKEINESELESLNELLPAANMNDPQVRQEEAFKKLKKKFATPNMPSEARREFIRNIDEDLRGNMDSQQLVSKLFENLPKEAWPLIFTHFSSDICHNWYNHYYEEKSHGGSFKRVKREEAPKTSSQPHNIGSEMVEKFAVMIEENPKKNASKLNDVLLWSQIGIMEDVGQKLSKEKKVGFQHMETWIQTAAETLGYMIGNPLLTDERGEQEVSGALQTIFQEACDTNTIYQIIRRFIEIVPCEKFVPTMEQFAKSCFYYNKDDLKDLIGYCLNEAKINKTDFIAKCLIDYHQKRSQIGYSELVYQLWKEPILKLNSERAEVVKSLIKQMGVQFLSYFTQNTKINDLMIKSLLEADPEFSKKLYVDSVSVICQVKNSNEEKFNMFQNLSSSYMAGGLNILELIPNDLMPIVKEWYLSKNVGFGLVVSKECLRLLQALNPDEFYSILSLTFESLLNEKHVYLWHLSSFWETLNDNGHAKPLLQILSEGPKKNLLQIFSKKLQDELTDSALCFFSKPFSFDLLAQMIPDWKERLFTSTKEDIKEEKQDAMEYGRKAKIPHNLERKFEYLSEAGKIDIWLSYVSQSKDEELKKYIELGYPAWLKEKEKKAKEKN